MLPVPVHLNASNTHTNNLIGPVFAQASGPRYSLHLLIIIVSLFVTNCLVKYFISDLPPLGSGLKTLPGPLSTIPYIGRVHDLDRNAVFRSVKKFNDKYNGLFSMTLGGEKHIFVSREDIANDLLCRNAEIASGRNDLGAYPGVTKDSKYLPLLGYTESFHRQRRFAVSTMTSIASRKFNGHIDLEMKRFMQSLLHVETAGAFYDLTILFAARITARLAYGSAESASEHAINAGAFIHQLSPSGPVTNLLPFLGWFPEWLVPAKRDVRLRQEAEKVLWEASFYDTKAKYEKGELAQLPTYVGAALEARERGGEEKRLFEEEEAIYAVGMLCTVAIFTIAGAATCFIMAMVIHPEWQKKVRDEIDNIVNSERMLELGDSAKLPTLRAALKEAVRWRSPVPLGGSRLLKQDYSFGGYHFPKHSVVHVIDVGIAHDSERYEDPHVYNPDRWLNPESKNFKAPLTEFPRIKGHHVFGRGKRTCPGQDLVESELLVFGGNLLKNFQVEPKIEVREGNKTKCLPNPDKWGTDVIGGPAKFECNIRIRSEDKRTTVEKMYREAYLAKS
ncbi:cytochrome P450 oxidoreductase [Polyplosphaeria fusca]|uniref:Cytochrome P450 oxidoreductase n=1 Tax=Polyplosphaeria fusca TaxID=682080 RepID=A0A9P4R2X8_9PLEO|nr:cytochrome P450 oxidoreductase [Polyplosphaeria fusca]